MLSPILWKILSLLLWRYCLSHSGNTVSYCGDTVSPIVEIQAPRYCGDTFIQLLWGILSTYYWRDTVCTILGDTSRRIPPIVVCTSTREEGLAGNDGGANVSYEEEEAAFAKKA